MKHTYLLLQAKSIAGWQTAARTTHRRQGDNLLRQADSYLTYLPPEEHPRDSITYIGMAAANLALAGLLTGRDDYLQGLRRWLERGIGYPQWGLARLPNHDLDAAWLLFGFSLAYSWVGDRLPPDERAALRVKLLHHGQLLYEYALETEGRWWGSAYWQNHNWICHTALMAAGYVFQPEHPPARQWLEQGRQNMAQVLELLPADGSDYEGVVYWRYGIPWLLLAAHLAQEQDGLNWHDNDFLRHTFFYRLYLSGPNLVDTLNFGDCHDRRSAHSRAVCYRLASLYRNGYAQWLAEHFEETGEWEREGREGLVKPGLLPEAWLDFIWYDPSVQPQSVADLPPGRVFPDMGLVSFRSGWQASDTVLAFKCGTPGGRRAWHLGQAFNRLYGWDIIRASHDHPDTGSFILVRGPDYGVVDEGYSKAKLSRHHSVVLVDGRGQYQEGEYNAFRGLEAGWGGRLEHWFITSGLMYARGEAAPAYPAELALKRFTRQIVMLSPRTVLLHDRLDSAVPHRYEWLVQLDSPPQPLAEDRFQVQGAESTLSVAVLSPRPVQAETAAQEITANPTSAKPDWILRHTQHTLALQPAQPVRQTSFFVALDFADRHAVPAQVSPVECQNGQAVRLEQDGRGVLAAFAEDKRPLHIPDVLLTDAGWCVIEKGTADNGLWLWAGRVTYLWFEQVLQLVASLPVDVALSAGGCVVQAPTQTWLEMRVRQLPRQVRVNHQPVHFREGKALNHVYFPVPAGRSEVQWVF